MLDFLQQETSVVNRISILNAGYFDLKRFLKKNLHIMYLIIFFLKVLCENTVFPV